MHLWPNEVGVGWLCRCPGIVWEPIRNRAHTQLVREHSVTVVPQSSPPPPPRSLRQISSAMYKKKCVPSTTTHFDSSTPFSNYHVFHSPAIKHSVRGRRSGGAAVFINKKFMPFVTRMGCEYDNMNCIKISKDDAGLNRNLLFVAVYVPPYQSPYYWLMWTAVSTMWRIFFWVHIRLVQTLFLTMCDDFNVLIGTLNVLIDDVSELFGDGVCRDNTRES